MGGHVHSQISYLENAATAFGADDRVMVILQGLELVIAHIGEVVGVDGASGEPDDHRARSGIGHIPAHKLQRVFPPWPREPRLNDRPVPTHPRLARVGSHHSSICVA